MLWRVEWWKGVGVTSMSVRTGTSLRAILTWGHRMFITTSSMAALLASHHCKVVEVIWRWRTWLIAVFSHSGASSGFSDLKASPSHKKGRQLSSLSSLTSPCSSGSLVCRWSTPLVQTPTAGKQETWGKEAAATCCFICNSLQSATKWHHRHSSLKTIM